VKLSRVLIGSTVAVSLVGAGLMATPVAAQDECGVGIYGGDVFNETVIDLNADAGTAISDASAGSNNAATTSGGGEGINTASAGNGGLATASASGGAIGVGNINSGGNVGNAVSVGNTYCDVAPAAPDKKADKGYDDGGYADDGGGYGGGDDYVAALPDTGVGIGDASSLFALLASASAAAASLGLRRR
jgi:hypothetical protein